MTHLALVGPTASGKSTLAMEIARSLGDVEIVSCDSMQVYRGLDIGTAKATPAQRAEIPHHLVDVAEPDEEWSVVRFQSEARDAVANIEGRGKRALLVGGTGLYFQAVVDDLRIPGEDPDVRADLEARTAQPGGVAAAYAELEAADPVAAAKIDPHNVRRIVRALEVIAVTGEPFSSFGPGVGTHGVTAFPVRIAGVWVPRAALAGRIVSRVAAMRDGGVAREVAGLRGHLGRTAGQAIGYKELLALPAPALEGGGEGTEPVDPDGLDEAFDQIVRRTRSFARRQRMWFRRDPRIVWYATARNPEGLARAILASWSR